MTENLVSSVRISLYTPFQIALVSFLGTILAGIFCLALNYRQVHNLQSYKLTLLLAMFVVPLVIFCYAIFPSTDYDSLWPLVTAFVMWAAAYMLQGNMIESAMEEGAFRKSIPALIGMILFSLILLLVLLVVAMKVFGFKLA